MICLLEKGMCMILRFYNICITGAIVMMVVMPAAGADRIVVDAGGEFTLDAPKYTQYVTETENGGLVFNAGTLELNSGVVVTENSGVFGGAIWNQGTITQNLNSGAGQLSFFRNKSTNAGGAIYNSETGVIKSLSHVLFQENTAAMGGAINNSKVNAAAHGGVIELISNTSFIGNSAGASQGGAIRNQGKINDIVDSLFMQNTAGNGGAINNGSWGSVVNGITNTQFVNNTALAGDWQQGGAIVNAGVINRIEASEFSGNQAGKNGGAIANVINTAGTQPVISLKDVQFLNNRAGVAGGAIYNEVGAVVNLDGDNIFSGNTAGDDTNDIHNLGQVVINSGVTKFGGGITGTGELTIKSDATMDIGATTVTQGIINLDGTVSMSVLNADSYGQLMADTYNIADGGVVRISLGTAGTYELFSDGWDGKLEYNDSMYNMSLDGGHVTFSTKSVDEIADKNNLTTAAATVMAGLANVGDYSVAVASLNAQQALASGNTEYIEQESKKLGAYDVPVVQSVAASVQGQALSLAAGRMSGASVGRSGGDAIATEYGVWARGMFNHTQYSDVFTGNMRGIAVGIDGQINKKYTVGLGYSYNRADLDANARDTNVENNTLFVYGQYQPNKWYINATANYTMSKYMDTANVFGIMIESEYDTTAFGGAVMTGYDFAFGLAPMAGVRYLHIDSDEYDNGILTINADATNYLTGVVGAQYDFVIGADWMVKFRPELHAAATYDFLSDSALATVTGIDSVAYVVDGGRLSRFGGEFGIGLAMMYDGWDISVNYALNLHSDYTSQTGMLKFRYDF